MKLFFEILYPVVVSYIFFLYQRDGLSTGRKFIKEYKGSIYIKEQKYCWYNKKYIFLKIPEDSDGMSKIKINQEEYDSINEKEKIIEN